MDRGYPRLISWDFQRVGSRVDAVFENYGEDLLVFRYRHFEKMLPCLIRCMFPFCRQFVFLIWTEAERVQPFFSESDTCAAELQLAQLLLKRQCVTDSVLLKM